MRSEGKDGCHRTFRKKMEIAQNHDDETHRVARTAGGIDSGKRKRPLLRRKTRTALG